MKHFVHSSLAALLASTGAAAAQQGPAHPPPNAATAAPAHTEDEIVVLADGDQQRIDRSVYTLRADAAAQNTNMLDVLGRIPAVSVAPSGAITLLGAGNVLIQINGQPVPDISIEQMLRGVSGGDVERIEVITNPPAQYSAQASGGIINIITRQNRSESWSGSTQTSLDTTGSYYLGFSPNWSRGPWSVGGQLGVYGGEIEQAFEREREQFSPAASILEKGAINTENRGFSLGRLQLGYRPTERRRFGVSLDYGDVFNDVLRPTATTRDGVPFSEQAAQSENHFFNHQMNFNFQQDGAQPGNVLRASGYLQDHGAEFDQLFSQTPSGGALGQFRALNDVALRAGNAKVDYERRLTNNNMLTLGASLDASTLGVENSRETLIGPPALADYTALLDGRQQTLASYGTIQIDLGDWTIQPGLRLESYRREVVGGAGESDSIEDRSFPSIHLRRALTDALNLTLSYTSRIQRPFLPQLDPTLRFVDVDRAIAGNPNLRPTTTDAYEIGLAYQSGGANLGVTFYDRVSEDIVSPFVQIGAGGAIVTSPVNAGTSEQRGLQTALRGPLGERWRYSLTANLLNREFDAFSAGALARRSEFEYDGVAQIDYREPDQNQIGADQLQFELRFQGPRHTLQSDIDEFIVGNFTWRRRLSSAMFGALSIQDIFSSQDQVQETTTASYFERSDTQGVGARLRLALTYQFGANANREPPPEPPPPAMSQTPS